MFHLQDFSNKSSYSTFEELIITSDMFNESPLIPEILILSLLIDLIDFLICIKASKFSYAAFFPFLYNSFKAS